MAENVFSFRDVQTFWYSVFWCGWSLAFIITKGRKKSFWLSTLQSQCARQEDLLNTEWRMKRYCNPCKILIHWRYRGGHSSTRKFYGQIGPRKTFSNLSLNFKPKITKFTWTSSEVIMKFTSKTHLKTGAGKQVPQSETTEHQHLQEACKPEDTRGETRRPEAFRSKLCFE